MKECSVEGCPSAVTARGLCHKHYMRLRSKGSTDDARKNAAQPCVMDGCPRNAAAYGYCHNHKFQSPQYVARKEAKRSQQRAGRKCLHCAEALPAEKNMRAIYCSAACKTKRRVADGRASEAALRFYFKRRYGLTPDQVDEMAAAGCGICGTVEWSGRHSRPHVDHDHKTGRVRGILCSECNTGLGKFRDDPELLRRALQYLSP